MAAASTQAPDARSAKASAVWRLMLPIWLVATLLVYTANDRLLGSGDTVPAALIPVSLLLDGTVMLDRFAAGEARRQPPQPYYLVRTPRGTASFYPIATGVLATPVLAIPILYRASHQPLDTDGWRDLAVRHYEKEVASLFAALAVAVFWSICSALGFSLPLAFGSTALYAFGSEVFAVASQALWQHGPGSLCILCVIRCLLALERRPVTASLLLGLFAGLAVAIRPTNLVLVAPLVALALYRRPQPSSWAAMATAALVALLPIAIYNEATFGHAFGGYGSVAGQLAVANLPAGLAGVLLSPARGLIWYFPATILALVLLARRPALWPNGMVIALVAGIALLIGVVASWPLWYGGYCFGPRLLSEAQASIVLLIGMAFPAGSRGRVAVSALLGVVLVWSVSIQIVGGYSLATITWSGSPSVDDNPARLWDFADNPVFRGVRANLN